MRLVWNEPSKINVPWYPYSTSHWEQAILGWLNYMGVWPEKSRDYWQCEYNYLYHFFDIHIFECWLPGHGKPDEVIRTMREYLGHSDLDWNEHSSFRWDNGKQRPGVRFWIQAEDHPRPFERRLSRDHN